MKTKTKKPSADRKSRTCSAKKKCSKKALVVVELGFKDGDTQHTFACADHLKHHMSVIGMIFVDIAKELTQDLKQVTIVKIEDYKGA